MKFTRLTFGLSSSLLTVDLLNKLYALAVGDDTAMNATRARRRVILVIVRERERERGERREEPTVVRKVGVVVALDTKV